MAIRSLEQVQRIRLNTPNATRKTIARFIGLLQREDPATIDYEKYKLILNYLREYRQLFAFEKDMAIERRIKALEEARKESEDAI